MPCLAFFLPKLFSFLCIFLLKRISFRKFWWSLALCPCLIGVVCDEGGGLGCQWPFYSIHFYCQYVEVFFFSLPEVTSSLLPQNSVDIVRVVLGCLHFWNRAGMGGASPFIYKQSTFIEFSYFHHLSSSCPLMWICNLLSLIFFGERLLASLSSRKADAWLFTLVQSPGTSMCSQYGFQSFSLLFTPNSHTLRFCWLEVCVKACKSSHHFEYIDFVFKYLVRWVPPHSSEFSCLVSDTCLPLSLKTHEKESKSVPLCATDHFSHVRLSATPYTAAH